MTDRTAAELAAEALRPFAHAWSGYTDWRDDEYVDHDERIRISDLRHATEALAALTAEVARVSPSREAMEAAVCLEIQNTLGLVTTQSIGALIDQAVAVRQLARISPDREAKQIAQEVLAEMRSDDRSSFADILTASLLRRLSALPLAVGEWRPIESARIDVPPALVEKLRTRCLPDLLTLTKVDDDIWISPGPIALHTDDTAEGLATYGVVLLNDGDYFLLYEGRTHDLPVGSIYLIDGRKPHGVIDAKGQIGRFAFLAWDMPPDYSTGTFADEVRARLPAPPQEKPNGD